MNKGVAIHVSSLTKVYGSGNTEVVAMKNVSMQINFGEVIALLGPSGSGKSTFLTAVGLINPPTGGKIEIRGETVMDGTKPMVNLRKFRKQHIGYVFQKSNLIPFLSAIENVQVAMEINGVSKRKAKLRSGELLEQLGLKGRFDNLPSMLSGGQQQRVAICRALANNPAVILADEPTAALDSHLGKQVMTLFRDVAHNFGTAVVVVTHDHRALDVFDSLYEMEDGVINRTDQMPMAVH